MRFAASALSLLAALFSACGAPTQNGGVEVRAGAANRLAAACRWRRGEVGRDACAAPDARARAAVTRIGSGEKGSPLRGALAIGRAGDYLIQNNEVVFVVDQLGRGTGFAESGGNLVDAADARVRADELGQLFTYFGAFPRQAVYDHLETGAEADGSAWVDVRGHELYEGELAVHTRYTLAAGARALVITTELENKGDRPLDPIDLGDAVQWGSTEKVARGKPVGFSGDHEGSVIGAVGRRVSYALAPTSIACDGCPKAPSYAAHNGTAWTNASYARGVVILPGKTARYQRALFVGARGDGASLDAELFYGLANGAPGGVSFELVDAHGAPVRSAKARVAIEPRLESPVDVAPLYFRPAPGDGGEVGGELEPGRYLARFEGDGRESAPVSFEVAAGAVAKVRLVLGEGAHLRIVATESGRAVPAKLQVFDASTRAALGRPELSLRGAADVGVAAGRYRVIASRGPEYALAEATVDAAAGATVDVPLALHRVVDTSGYIGCDFHQHTSWSADSGVTIAERVLSNAVEGVECAVASEHNNVVDFAPVIRELGLEKLFRSISGDEITSDASRVPFGHANVFPLVPDPTDARGGAFPVRDRTAHEIFDDVRRIAGHPIIQINHPRAGHRIGYFEELKFDPRRGVGDGAGYDAGFNAVEVWSGRHVKDRDRVLADFWALLRSGHPVTPTANTDTHGIVMQEAGYPRTYVRVADDDPARLDVASLVEGLRVRRDVVLTNGPFISVGAAAPGSMLTLRATPIELRVRVERAPWVDASELRVIVDGVPSDPVALPDPRPTPRGALANEVVVKLERRQAAPEAARFVKARGGVTVELSRDAAVSFVVVGRRPLEPVLSGAPPEEIAPFAMTSPPLDRRRRRREVAWKVETSTDKR